MMMRHNPRFRRAVAQIEPLLEELGFRLVREVYDHACFGSSFAEYKRRGALVRVAWDGKESMLFVDTRHPLSRTWSPVDGMASLQTGSPGNDASDEGIQGVCVALASRFQGRGRQKRRP